VLYDIYHAGMMKEDIFADIKEHHDCWGHFHTGGVPGRNEIDETQTLDYAKILKAIADTGFKGYVAQEFISQAEGCHEEPGAGDRDLRRVMGYFAVNTTS